MSGLCCGCMSADNSSLIDPKMERDKKSSSKSDRSRSRSPVTSPKKVRSTGGVDVRSAKSAQSGISVRSKKSNMKTDIRSQEQQDTVKLMKKENCPCRKIALKTPSQTSIGTEKLNRGRNATREDGNDKKSVSREKLKKDKNDYDDEIECDPKCPACPSKKSETSIITAKGNAIEAQNTSYTLCGCIQPSSFCYHYEPMLQPITPPLQYFNLPPPCGGFPYAPPLCNCQPSTGFSPPFCLPQCFYPPQPLFPPCNIPSAQPPCAQPACAQTSPSVLKSPPSHGTTTTSSLLVTQDCNIQPPPCDIPCQGTPFLNLLTGEVVCVPPSFCKAADEKKTASKAANSETDSQLTTDSETETEGSGITQRSEITVQTEADR